MQQAGTQKRFVCQNKLFEAAFPVSRQKMDPRSRDGLVIKPAQLVVLRERVNSAAHVVERGFKRLSRQVQPGQPQVISVAKLGG